MVFVYDPPRHGTKPEEGSAIANSAKVLQELSLSTSLLQKEAFQNSTFLWALPFLGPVANHPCVTTNELGHLVADMWSAFHIRRSSLT